MGFKNPQRAFSPSLRRATKAAQSGADALVPPRMPVETQGIMAVHRLGIVPPREGQLDTYTFTPLQGIATHPLDDVVSR